jgi:hypothetical protein
MKNKLISHKAKWSLSLIRQVFNNCSPHCMSEIASKAHFHSIKVRVRSNSTALKPVGQGKNMETSSPKGSLFRT